MSKPENQSPKAALEEGEFIECFSVELGGLMDRCREWEAQGFAIDARVGKSPLLFDSTLTHADSVRWAGGGHRNGAPMALVDLHLVCV